VNEGFEKTNTLITTSGLGCGNTSNKVYDMFIRSISLMPTTLYVKLGSIKSVCIKSNISEGKYIKKR
jgi:hypothetical protein